jgi:CHAD domain-containing protein
MSGARAPEPGKILAPIAKRLLARLDRVVRDPRDGEAIHDARVAARRFLAAGELWSPWARGWEDLRRRLPRLVRRLGRVRNLDVTIGLLTRGRAADRASRRAFAGWLRRRRRKERGALSEWLTLRRVRRIRRRIREALRIRDARRAEPADLGIHFTRILSLAVLSPWSEHLKAAHEVRREVRRLRYGHETLRWAYRPADYERAQRKLLDIQDRAGAWHDRCVLERLAARAIREGGLSAPLDPLLARARSEAKALARRFVIGVSSLMDLRPSVTREEGS